MGRVYVRRPARKSPGGLRHAGDAPYRCFLPDLTRFGAPAAQDPGSSQRAPVIVSQRVARHKIAPSVMPSFAKALVRTPERRLLLTAFLVRIVPAWIVYGAD